MGSMVRRAASFISERTRESTSRLRALKSGPPYATPFFVWQITTVGRSGPGPSAVDSLFQPFQKGAEATGLGLYLSRALLRSFRGDLRYDPAVPGCSFVIDLAVVTAEERIAVRTGTYDSHPIVAG